LFAASTKAVGASEVVVVVELMLVAAFVVVSVVVEVEAGAGVASGNSACGAEVITSTGD